MKLEGGLLLKLAVEGLGRSHITSAERQTLQKMKSLQKINLCKYGEKEGALPSLLGPRQLGRAAVDQQPGTQLGEVPTHDGVSSHQETSSSKAQRDEAALRRAANVFPRKGSWWAGLLRRGEPGAGTEQGP